MKTKATMQSNQTGRNALGLSLPGALLGTLKLTALYPVANPSIWLSFCKHYSDWTHSIRGDHSPCRYG